MADPRNFDAACDSHIDVTACSASSPPPQYKCEAQKAEYEYSATDDTPHPNGKRSVCAILGQVGLCIEVWSRCVCHVELIHALDLDC
mmetsp:Transcript_7638/g.19987  ORF Transcript_7638/g.19987 Transcript_7638/m.19987 type:complete len:87 (+) Transcript_7638:737-997(+)